LGEVERLRPQSNAKSKTFPIRSIKIEESLPIHYFVITDSIFLIDEFYKNDNTNHTIQQKLSLNIGIKKIISQIELPEKILIPLAGLHYKLQGNTIICTALGAEKFEFPIKQYIDFADMIYYIKYF
jgi:hypothetical protein